jgi:hypothetical protein
VRASLIFRIKNDVRNVDVKQLGDVSNVSKFKLRKQKILKYCCGETKETYVARNKDSCVRCVGARVRVDVWSLSEGRCVVLE